MEYKTYGRHIVADIWGADFKKLDDVEFLKEHMARAAEISGATILDVSYKKFDPFGATVLILLSESHLSIHTYPEKGFAAIDGYTCGDSINPQDSIDYLIEILQPHTIYSSKIIRGAGNFTIVTVP